MFRVIARAGIGACLLTCLFTGRTAVGQERELPIDRKPSKLSGVRIRSAWVGGGYYNLQRPAASGVLKTDFALGTGGAAIGWNRNTERTGYWANYAGEYNRASKSVGNIGAANHGTDFGFFHRVTPKVTWRTWGEGEFLSYSGRQFRYPGPTAGARPGEGGSAGAVGLLDLDPAQGGFIRGASDANLLVVGDQYRRYAAATTFNYAQSVRSSMSFGINAQRLDFQATDIAAFIPFRKMHDLSTNYVYRYNLTPRTVVAIDNQYARSWGGVNLSSGQRTVFDRGYSMLQLARTFTTHWYGSVGGGYSGTQALTGTGDRPWIHSYAATAQLGHVTRDAAFLANVQHMTGDSYGIGAQSNDQVLMSYTYRPVQAAWGANVAMMYQRLGVKGLPTIDGFVGMLGVSRRVTRHSFVFFEVTNTTNINFTAVRLAAVAPSRNVLDTLAQRAVRVTYVYNPMPNITR